MKALQQSLARIAPAWWILMGLLLLYPFFANDFFILQIGAYSLILGMIALSLMILAGYGGMVSLAQITVAGIAAYLVPILGSNSQGVMGFGWSWWAVAPLAILGAAIFSSFMGILAVRTSGIYTIMITLAIAVLVSVFTRQNYEIFNGFTGFSDIMAPEFWGIYWRNPTPFYYLCLCLATLFLALTVYIARSPYGISLMAIRDNPRRMSALGFHVIHHKIFAFFLSGLVAGTAGILLVLFNGRVSPGTIGVDVAIDILVIAVIGGLRHPIGPFIGALAFVLLETFAIDLVDRERFNTLIGAVFLLIVFFSPDGLLGLWKKYGFKPNFKKI